MIIQVAKKFGSRKYTAVLKNVEVIGKDGNSGNDLVMAVMFPKPKQLTLALYYSQDNEYAYFAGMYVTMYDFYVDGQKIDRKQLEQLVKQEHDTHPTKQIELF